MRIGLISLIVLLVLPASYSAVTLTMDQARKEGIKQFVGKEFANYTIINQVYKSSSNELVLTVVGDPISEEELETIRQKQASYGIQSVQLKVKQFNNSAKLDSETIKEFYENIDKYIDQKLSEKDSQDDIVKEIEADKDWGYWPYQLMEANLGRISYIQKLMDKRIVDEDTICGGLTNHY